MRSKDVGLAQKLYDGLSSYEQGVRRLPGIRSKRNRDALVGQILESVHRVEYPKVISARQISELRADPRSPIFDPLRAAILRKRQGQFDEAFWFVFLFVHFGKHLRTGWQLARNVYGKLGQGEPWTWARISDNPRCFRTWLEENNAALRANGAGHFGNHRKYESLNGWSRTGTGEAVESYVRWVGPPRTHKDLIGAGQKVVGSDPSALFHHLYNSMDQVTRFGRTAKFDYLTMISKIGLAPIEPGSTYMDGSTGPFAGACLLFGNGKTTFQRSELDTWIVELGGMLGLGMQVMEDALCNWQKSPDKFKAFRG